MFGTARLLDSIASFAADGGLREAASWVSLRQHIYVSLTSQSPLSINLHNYRHSRSFSESTDEAYANRIVFIFASFLTHVFTPRVHHAEDEWVRLEAELEEWCSSRPWRFSPLWDGSQAEGDRTGDWPEILMSCPAQGMS